MKAYSLDFRQKIIDVYNKEEISQRQLAKRFDVALSFTYELPQLATLKLGFLNPA